MKESKKPRIVLMLILISIPSCLVVYSINTERHLGIFFYELQDMTNGCLRIDKLVEKDNFIKRWYEIVRTGFSWINFSPMGYYDDGFVFCIEHNNESKVVPMGLTTVLLPGLPMDMEGNNHIKFNSVINLIE